MKYSSEIETYVIEENMSLQMRALAEETKQNLR